MGSRGDYGWGVKRIGLLLVGVLLAVLVVPASANAYRHQLAVPANIWAHHFLNPGCDGPCANPATREIWIGKHPNRFSVSHEIGHVFWDMDATDAQRSWITAKIAPGAPWDGTQEDYDEQNQIAGELAADAYATCDLGLTPGKFRRHGQWAMEWQFSYGYMPSVRLHRQVCRFISAARR